MSQTKIPTEFKMKRLKSISIHHSQLLFSANVNFYIFQFVFYSVPKTALPTVDRSATQAEEMRQQRNQEARQLIGGSVNKAKAIFIQNTSSAAVGPTKAAKTAPAKPIRNSITRSTGSQNQLSPDRKSQPVENAIEINVEPAINVEPIEVTPPEPATYTTHINNNGQMSDVVHEPSSPQHGLSAGNDDDSDAYSTIKRSPYIKSNTNNNQETTPTPESKEIKSDNGAQPEQLYANSYGKWILFAFFLLYWHLCRILKFTHFLV